jgi:hypothetical protein
MSCRVFKFTYLLDGGARIHYALFLVTNVNFGTLIHVKGNLYEGMIYRTRDDVIPDYRSPFYCMDYLGVVQRGNIADFKRICESIPAPRKQLDDQGRKIYTDVPLYSRENWFDEVISMLREADVLENTC